MEKGPEGTLGYLGPYTILASGIILGVIAVLPLLTTPRGEHVRTCEALVSNHRDHCVPMLRLVKKGLLTDIAPELLQSLALRGLHITDYLDAVCDDVPGIPKKLERVRRLQQVFAHGVTSKKEQPKKHQSPSRESSNGKPEYDT